MFSPKLRGSDLRQFELFADCTPEQLAVSIRCPLVCASGPVGYFCTKAAPIASS